MKSLFASKASRYFLLFALFICHHASAQIKTVIPANNKDNIVPSTTDGVELTFNLNTLPANCEIKSCQLQLTCEVPMKDYSPQLIVSSATGKMITNRALKPLETTKETVISLAIGTAYLPSPGDTGYRLWLKLSHSIATSATFFSAKGTLGNRQGFAPRLVVTYNYKEGEKPSPVADWASLYSNYQHTSQTPVYMKGAAPRSFEKTEVGGMGKVMQNLVMYRDHIYIIGDNGPNVYSVDLTTLKTAVVSSALSGDKNNSTPVIDQFGHLYHAALNEFAVTDLNNNQYSGARQAAGNINNGLTAGPDGSLYVPCDNSISAYTPFPQNALIWDVYITSKKSAVTLNNAGTIAYVLTYNSGRAARLLAFSANTGKQIGNADITLDEEPGSDEFLPAPVVDDNGYVYIANRVIGARHLYILKEGLTQFKEQIAGRVSMPAAMIDDHLKIKGMYFIKDDALFKYDSDSLKATRLITVEENPQQPFSVRSFITDQSNGIYYSRVGEAAFYYKPAASNTFVKTEVPGVNFEKNLTIGVDGSLYTAVGNSLIAVKATSYRNSYKLTTPGEDQYRNNISFTGNYLTIQDEFIFSNYKYLKALIGITFLGKATLTKNAEVLIKVGKAGSVSFGNNFTVNKGAVLQVKTSN
jgi:hypothetical protein